MNYLLFVLSGTMSAWGKPLPGNNRKTEDHPTKSGVTGFVASCLGITRKMEKEYTLLSDIGYACREDLAGAVLKDFQTVQVGPGIISERYYLINTIFTVCLWKNKYNQSLNTISKAITKPVHAPFLGRKNCPLNRPPSPRIVNAKNLSEAFDKYPYSTLLKDILTSKEYKRIFWEGKDKSITKESSSSRFDQPSGIRRYNTRIEHTGWKEANYVFK